MARDKSYTKRSQLLNNKYGELTPLSLEEMLTKEEEFIDLVELVKGRYCEDELFSKILDNPKRFKNYEVNKNEGTIYLKTEEKKLLCIPAIIV